MSLTHEVIISYDPSEPFECTLEDTDLLILEEFVAHARKVEACQLVQIGMPFSFKLQIGQDISTSTTSLPNWDLVEVYLHRIRPIILQNERTNFFKVCSLLTKNIRLPSVLKQVKEEKELYSGARIHSVVQITSNGELLTSEKVLQDYLNGFEYHRDSNRQANLEKLNWLLPLESSHCIWYWLLSEKGASILRLADWIRHLSDSIRQVATPALSTRLLSCTLAPNT